MTPLAGAGSAPRRVFETSMRWLGLALLLLLLWRSLDPAAPSRRADRILTLSATDDSSALVRALVRELGGNARAGRPLPLIVRALGAEGDRAALQAFHAAGHTLAWRDSTAARGLLIGLAALPDPQGASVITASADGRAAPLVVRDGAGVIDSLAGDDSAAAGATRTTVIARAVAGVASAQRGASVARVPADSVAPIVRRVLLYARPGWEAKFTTAALEEAGWRVDGSIAIAPRASVTIGAPRPLDTARYAAAIVLDSGVAPSAALERFARSGGGVIVAGDGVRDRALTNLLPASANEARPPVPGALLTDDPAMGLERYPLAPRAASIVLAVERPDGARSATPMQVAARRGSGRVVASGYRESWRWRMEGGNDGIAAHRRWWNGLVRSVAYAPATSLRRTESYPGESAPYADLVARLGAPTVASGEGSPPAVESRSSPLPLPSSGVLLVLACAAFLTEWISRRLRGAR